MVYSYTIGSQDSGPDNKGSRKTWKKIVLVVLFFLLLAGASFGGGILAAKKNPSLEKYIQFIKERRTGMPAGGVEMKVSNEIPESEAVVVQEEPAPETKVSEEIPKVENVPEPVKFSFGIVGDSQYFKPGAGGSYQTAAANIKKMNVDLVMAEGDLVSSCKKGECNGKLNSWKSVWGNLISKVYPTQGNHDRTDGEDADKAWQSSFSLPGNGPAGYSELVYSFDFQNSHFVVLDSEKPKERKINSDQRAWLERDLNANIKENTFVFFHEPAYPVSSKIGESLDEDPGERNALWNILTAHKVTAVFNGHEHIHSRRKINGLYQLVFGNTNSFNHEMPGPGVAEYAYQGENFGIVKVEDKKITVELYNISGKLLNSYTFSK